MDWIKERFGPGWTSSRVISRLLHFITLALCLAAAFYQVGKLMDIFLKYPVTISISTEHQSELYYPGITLCTSVGISLRYYRENEEQKEKWDAMVRQRKAELNISENAGLPAYHRQDVINQLNTEYLSLQGLPEIVAASLGFTDLVLMAKCANRDVEKEDCLAELERTFLETLQGDFMCWTMFHESQDINSKLFESVAPSGYKQSPFLMPDKGLSFDMLNQTMQPQEVVRLLVNLSATEPIQLGQQADGIISVHDYDQIKLNRRKAVILQPGNYYEISYEEEGYESLPAPYKSHCLPYVREYLPWYDGTDPCVHQFFDAPLSRSDCFHGCMALKAISKPLCSCYPPEIPYLAKDINCTLEETWTYPLIPIEHSTFAAGFV